MAKEGRITGRVNGDTYELVQFGEVRVTLPVADIDDKFRRAIKANGWEAVP